MGLRRQVRMSLLLFGIKLKKPFKVLFGNYFFCPLGNESKLKNPVVFETFIHVKKYCTLSNVRL